MAKLSRLMEEYLGERSQATELFGSKTSLTRSLAYEEHVPVTSEITTYEQARKIIKEAGYGAVQICYCRHKKEHVGEKCKKGAPVEGWCISLGAGARFLTRRGFAEEKSVDELLAVLDQARALRLTHITDNIRQYPSFICNCCSCCCEIMHGVQAGFHNGLGKTGFTAVIDSKLCEYCGECFTACNVKAIGAPERGALRDQKGALRSGAGGDLPGVRGLRVRLQEGGADPGPRRQPGGPSAEEKRPPTADIEGKRAASCHPS